MKRCLIFLLCAMIAFGLSACGGKNAAPGPEKMIGLGEDYLDGGDFEAALEQFLAYIDREPEDEYGYLCAAQAYIGMDDAEGAVGILEDGYDRTGSERIQQELTVISASSGPAAPPSAISEYVPEPAPPFAPENAQAPEAPPAPDELPDDLPDDLQAAVPEDGEYLYTGDLECPQAKNIQVSFILAADKSYIHDIKIVVSDLKASVQNGNRTTTVESSNITETHSGEFPVDFVYGSVDIPVGRHIIRSLEFEERSAFMILDYVYYNANPGGGMSTFDAPPIEIPLDPADGALVTENVPEDAGARSSAFAPGLFPVNYVAYGNPYSITDCTIGRNDRGQTTVTLWGEGYDVLHFGPSGTQLPAACEFTSGGETHTDEMVGVSRDSMIFTFDTSLPPETVTVTNRDTGEEIVSFAAADVLSQV